MEKKLLEDVKKFSDINLLSKMTDEELKTVVTVYSCLKKENAINRRNINFLISNSFSKQLFFKEDGGLDSETIECLKSPLFAN